MKIKKLIAVAFISLGLMACNQDSGNQKVFDVYHGQKSLIYKDLPKEDMDILSGYIARKTVRLQYYQDGVLSMDSKDKEHLKSGEWVEKVVKVENKQNSLVINGKETLFTGLYSTDVGNVYIYAIESNGVRIITQTFRPSEFELKELLDNVTVKEALAEEKKVIALKKEFEEQQIAMEEKNRLELELKKGLRIGFVEKLKSGENNLNIDFTFTNMFPKKIRSFQGVIEFYENNEIFYQLRIKNDDVIDVKSAIYYEGELSVVSDAEKHLLNMDSEKLRVKFKAEGVIFEDGAVMGLDVFNVPKIPEPSKAPDVPEIPVNDSKELSVTK